MTNDVPNAASFATPESSSELHELVDGAIGSSSDLVSSIKDQLTDSVARHQRSAIDQVANVRSSIRGQVEKGLSAANAAASNTRQQLVDSVQARINQAGSYVGVVANQASQLQATGTAPYAVCACGATTALSYYMDLPIGTPVGEVYTEPISGGQVVVLAGPFATTVDQAVWDAAHHNTPCKILMDQLGIPNTVCGGGGNWWVCCCTASSVGSSSSSNNIETQRQSLSRHRTRTIPPGQSRQQQPGQSSTSVCTFTFTASLTWPAAPPIDFDEYVWNVTDGGVCYYEALAAGGLVLNHDANPECASSPVSPEIITGDFRKTTHFRVWWNNYDPSCGNSPNDPVQSIAVLNTGTESITVNNMTIMPGRQWSTSIFSHDPQSGNQSEYSGGTDVIVTCGEACTGPSCGCTVATVVENPSGGMQCIMGPFSTEDGANAWLASNMDLAAAKCGGQPPPPMGWECVNGQCVVSPNGQYSSLEECQAACQITGPCCPQVTCPPATVNNYYNTNTDVLTTTSISNIRQSWTTIFETITETINNIKSVVNNISTTNITESIREINNYIGDLTNIIDSYNSNIANAVVGTNPLTVHLRSDNLWWVDVDINRLSDYPQWIQDTLNRVQQSWEEESDEDLGGGPQEKFHTGELADMFTES